MDISPIPTPNTSVTPDAADALAGGTEITSDFETFLKMLTVQLKNQDPLNPIESSDYAVQLATFSGVEQQVLTNDLLADLAAQLTATGMAQMASWVGMEARARTAAYFDGAPVTVIPAPEGSPDAVDMVVRDAAGTAIQRFAIDTGSEPISWAGVATDGAPLPAGAYTFETVSYALGEEIARNTSEVFNTVTEVRQQDGGIALVLRGGGTVDADSVTSVRNPALQ